MICATCVAQSNKTWGAFVNAIAAKPYVGKKFKIEAAIKVDLIMMLMLNYGLGWIKRIRKLDFFTT